MTRAGREELCTAVVCLLRNPDLSLREIARRLDVSPSYVQKVQQTYCPQRREDRYCSAPGRTEEANQERQEIVGRLLRENLSLAEIARRTGMADTTVSRIRRKYYAEIPRQPVKPHRPKWDRPPA